MVESPGLDWTVQSNIFLDHRLSPNKYLYCIPFYDLIKLDPTKLMQWTSHLLIRNNYQSNKINLVIVLQGIQGTQCPVMSLITTAISLPPQNIISSGPGIS